MLNTSSASNPKQTRSVWGLAMTDEPQLRTDLITNSDDYGIQLPDWLKNCIEQSPLPIGESCPNNADSLQ